MSPDKYMPAKPRRVLVAGANGRVGGALVALLAADGVPLRALVRRPPSALPPGVEVVTADLADKTSLAGALAGVEKVFMAISDSPKQPELEANLIDAAKAAGVSHVVKLSAFAAGLDPPAGYGVNHALSEARLAESGMNWTVLRPFMFMQNLLELAEPVRRLGILPLPLGSARVSLIDAQDIAAVGRAVLKGNSHYGARYELTGPESLDFHECASLVARVAGRRVRYLPVPEWLAAVVQRLQGVSGWDVRMRLALFRMVRAGGEAHVTNDVQRITGRPARTLAQFLNEHRNAFLRPGDSSS